MKGILGKKVGMTQVIKSDGEVVAATVLEVGPCYVTQVRTPDKDGYCAVQLGFGPDKAKHLSKGERGHLEQSGAPLLRHLRELHIREDEHYEVGQVIKADIFAAGEHVDVVGTSKGRGFAGVVKRHGMAGGPKTHGQSDRQRRVGSIGAGSSPGHVWKGVRMPGRMGAERVTSQNVEVVLVDPERNLLAVNGSVPGPNGGLVLVKVARKQKVAKGGK